MRNIWHDPVWSKVIAGIILASVGTVSGMLLGLGSDESAMDLGVTENGIIQPDKISTNKKDGITVLSPVVNKHNANSVKNEIQLEVTTKSTMVDKHTSVKLNNQNLQDKNQNAKAKSSCNDINPPLDCLWK